MSDSQKKHESFNISGSTIGNFQQGDNNAASDIYVSDISSSTGDTDEIAKVFTAILRKVDLLPEGPDKATAQNAVKALEGEARKGQEAQEGVIRKWLNFLVETAPDAWQVAVDTFTNPVKGLSTVFQKVAERAKSER